MTISEVEEHFEYLTYACDALNIAKANCTKWKRQGYIPWNQQWRLFKLTDGKLIPDAEDPVYARRQGKLCEKQK